MTSLAAFPALTLRAAALAACALLLQACGGGGSDDAGTSATVSGAVVDGLSYGRLSTVTINGTNLLTAGVSLGATGCDGITLLAGGTTLQQRFTCTPNKALSVRLSAAAGGSEFFTSTLEVPKPQVTLATSLGNVVIELEPAAAPLTVDNFLAYVNAGFYNGTIFHRVIKDFVVQGGGFTGVTATTLTPQTGARPAIPLETNRGLSNLRDTIAMARLTAPDTATSEFFFNTVNNAHLDYASAGAPGYAVFGRIVSGYAVVDAMNPVATRTVGGFFDVPVTNIGLQLALQTK